MFISLEGIDRSGKTTQAARLAEALGPETLVVREPGGTVAGERIRELVKDPSVQIDPLAELLLFCAARAQLIVEQIVPALEAGRTVLTDRYVDSSIAYQGAGRGLGTERVAAICREATGGLLPDLTLLLRIDPARAAGRGGVEVDRFESEGDGLQRAVAAAYDELAAAHPDRIRAIDADRPAEAVHADLLAAVRAARPTPAGGRG